MNDLATGDGRHTALHLPALDGIRGLAILSVLAFHYGYSAQSIAPAEGLASVLFDLFDFGWLGVDLFFVLSGFLITRILLRSKRGNHYFRSFYARRALRIFPPYYALLAIAFVLLPLSGHPLLPGWPSEHQAWIWLYAANLPIDAQWLDLGHLWTLAVEEHFYLFWPLLVFWLPEPRLRIACVLTIPIALTFRVLALNTALEAYSLKFTLARFDSLAIGALAATFSLDSLVDRRWIRRGTLPCLISSLALLAFCRLDSTARPSVICFGSPAFAGAFAGFVFLAAARALPRGAMTLLESRGLGRIGKYSYGMYLFHLPLLRISPRITSALGIPLSTFHGKIIWMVAMSLVAYTAAWVSWNVYERQFLRLKVLFLPG